MPVTFNEPLSFTQVREGFPMCCHNYLTFDITLSVNIPHRDLLKILNMLNCFIRLQVRKHSVPRYDGSKCNTLLHLQNVRIFQKHCLI